MDLRFGSGSPECLLFPFDLSGGLEMDGPNARLLDSNRAKRAGFARIDAALRGDNFPADDAAINQLHLTEFTGSSSADEKPHHKEGRNNQTSHKRSLSIEASCLRFDYNNIPEIRLIGLVRFIDPIQLCRAILGPSKMPALSSPSRARFSLKSELAAT